MELSRIIIFTSNVAKLAAFYRATFGLALVGEADAGWTELQAGGCNLAFHKASVKTAGKRDTGIKFVFGAKDVKKEKARLEKLGVKMGGIMEFEDLRMCDGCDPDGNRFQISSRVM